MSNYIILNGTNSNTINGLLIQSLPPISKPMIRANIEEIDGRDGDIVTKLGYSAYDKEIEIGLYGNYDIDEVIQYFNSEGTVTFSNEPEKYYNYQILDQIDFERLLRFKTATVIMHVQPFKYSTVEGEKTFNIENNLVTIPDFTKTTNGITLTVTDGTIILNGTGTAATEFYVPIQALNLEAGNYIFAAFADGTGVSTSSIRLIGSVPSNADSFGGNYLSLQNNTSVSLNSTLVASKTFNYIWFYINAGTALDYSLTVSVENTADNEITVNNNGNTYSKPIMTIYGTGTINLSLNGYQVFVIELADQGFITIDVNQMEAYQDGVLKNRLVTGDYDNFLLNPGKNTISFNGDVTQILIENMSRWI